MVVCDICGRWYDQRDPDVRYLAIDGAWTCVYEAECFAYWNEQEIYAADREDL